MTAAAISVSVACLTCEARSVLDHLNEKRLFPSDGPHRLPRDVRGLATLIGLTTQDALSVQETLDKWKRLDEDSATVGQLFQYLEKIDRYDVRDDLWELTAENRLVRIDQQVPQSQVREDMAITMDDLASPIPQSYDALVIFADADQEFVDVMYNNMKGIGFNLCRKSSLKPGVMEQEAMAELIDTRCRYSIIIFSKAFFESADERHYAHYAQAKQVRDNTHQMILCVYQPCQPSKVLRFYTVLRVDSNFWQFLATFLNYRRTPSLEIPSWVNSLEPARSLPASPTVRHGQVNELTYRAEAITSRVNHQISQLSQPNGQVVNNMPTEANSQISNAHVQPTNVISNETPHTPVADQIPANASNLTISTDSSIVTNSQDGGAHSQPTNAHISNGQTVNDSSIKQVKSPSAVTFIEYIKKVILLKKWFRGKSL